MSRISNTKSPLKHNRSPSVTMFKELVRKSYVEKLKLNRNQETNRRRALYELTALAVHQELLDSQTLPIVKSELNLDDMLQLFDEVENELNQKATELQVEKYDCELCRETELIAESLLDKCSVCDERFVYGGKQKICDTCFQLHFIDYSL